MHEKSFNKLIRYRSFKILLSAPLGKSPEIQNCFGHISLSHSNDAILIGWSNNKLGVDIEVKDRLIDARK